MPKYTIAVKIYGATEIKVEANSEEEAHIKARIEGIDVYEIDEWGIGDMETVEVEEAENEEKPVTAEMLEAQGQLRIV